MRRGVFIVLSSLAAGCAEGSTTESPDETPVIALSDPGHASLPDLNSGSSDAARTDRLRSPKHPAFAAVMPFGLVACKPGAFCDDFEDASPGSRWTAAVATNGVVDFVGPSSSLGAHALRASTNGAGAAAYLTLDGASLGKHWVGELAFSFRLDSLPTAAMGGPEIVVVDAFGATTRIGFSVRPEGIALHQHFESCSGTACTSRSDLVSDVKPGEWRHLGVAIETTGTTAPPYGRIEVTIDGGDLIFVPLTVTPFDGKAEAHAGITVADGAPATAHIDDVMFYVR